jgi:hypothetical protein
MTRTTPAPESSTRCSCPPPHCPQGNRPGAGHSVPRSWTGTHQDIARRRGTVGDRACSARAGPRRACGKRSADTGIRLVQGPRWGGCEAGTADSWAVALQTVQRLPRVAAQRAATHPRPSGQHVAGQGVPWAAAHATRRPKHVAWVPTAVAMGRGCRRWGDGGPRPQETAATLLA